MQDEGEGAKEVGEEEGGGVGCGVAAMERRGLESVAMMTGLGSRGTGEWKMYKGGGCYLQCLQMYAPAACEGEEETLCYYLGEGVGHGLGALLLDSHAGRESSDFEGVGAGEFVCC